MSIWRQLFGGLKGGWKTHGPYAADGAGAFDSDDTYDQVTADTSLRLAAVWACMNLRAEIRGSLPLHVRDKNKNILRDHPLYSILHDSPNSMQTAAEYWSMNTAHVDMHGNAISVIERRTRDKSVISLEPILEPWAVTMEQKKSGGWYYKYGQEQYPAENIFHLRGFSMSGYWGLPRVDIGRQILSSQLSANRSAMRAFKQGMKVGGFFEVERDLDSTQLEDFKKRLDSYGSPQNEGKWMTLLKGMKPIGGSDFRIKPADAELLQSRYFGIEEICRLFNVPPQLIGHTDKSSSWASSIEQVNLFFLMYSLQPGFVRDEQRIRKSLLSPADRAAGIEGRFGIQGLLRSDMKTQSAMFASALQNGYYNRNEVRDLLERGEIEGGDKYTVQLNMTNVNELDNTDGTSADTGDNKEPKK